MKSQKAAVKKVKDDPDFEKILIEPMLLQKPKRSAKIKSESESATPPPEIVKRENETDVSDTPSTIFDTLANKNPKSKQTEFGTFSSKFKQLSDSFDNAKKATNEVEEPKAETPKPVKHTKPRSRNANVALSSDEDDFDLSDSEDIIPVRKRAPRSTRAKTVPKKIATDVIDLSDDSFLEADEQSVSDESFHGSDD